MHKTLVKAMGGVLCAGLATILWGKGEEVERRSRG